MSASCRARAAWVEVVREFWRPPLRMHFESIADARELVSALGFDASQTRDRFRMMSPIMRSWLPYFAMHLTMQFGLRTDGPLWMLLGGAALMVVLIDERNRYVEIGPDGVFLRTLFKRLHLPTAGLRAVRRWRTGRGSLQLVFESDKRSMAAWMYES